MVAEVPQISQLQSPARLMPYVASVAGTVYAMATDTLWLGLGTFLVTAAGVFTQTYRTVVTIRNTAASVKLEKLRTEFEASKSQHAKDLAAAHLLIVGLRAEVGSNHRMLAILIEKLGIPPRAGLHGLGFVADEAQALAAAEAHCDVLGELGMDIING